MRFPRALHLVATLTLVMATHVSCAQQDTQQPDTQAASITPIFTPGDSLQYQHTLSTHDTNTVPLAGESTTQAMVNRTFTLDVISLNGDGSVDVSITLNRFQLLISQNGTVLVSFDSNNHNEPANRVERSLQQLATLSLRATLDADVNIIDMETITQVLPPDTYIPVQAQPFYDSGWFSTAITTAWKIDTDSNQLVRGDTWTRSLPNDFNDSTAVTTTHSFEVVSIDPDTIVIKGTGESDLQFTPTQSSDINTIEILEQALSLSLTWNRQLGALDRYDTEQLLTFEIVRDAMTTTTTRRSQASLRRIEANPASPIPPDSP
jgi:hypothetical protein